MKSENLLEFECEGQRTRLFWITNFLFQKKPRASQELKFQMFDLKQLRIGKLRFCKDLNRRSEIFWEFIRIAKFLVSNMSILKIRSFKPIMQANTKYFRLWRPTSDMPIGIDIWHWRKYAPSINLICAPPKRKLKHVSHMTSKQYLFNMD